MTDKKRIAALKDELAELKKAQRAERLAASRRKPGAEKRRMEPPPAIGRGLTVLEMFARHRVEQRKERDRAMIGR